MGVYNTILVNCPGCGALVEFQSKSGSSSMSVFRISAMPYKDLKDIIGESWSCGNCGNLVRISEVGEIDASDLVKGG